MTSTRGVEMSAGSLGQGLSFGVGVALAGRLDGRDFRVYVLLEKHGLTPAGVEKAARSVLRRKTGVS